MPEHPDATPGETSEDLGRTYAAMLGEQAWQVDMPEEVAPPAGAEGAADAVPPSPVRIIEALLFVGGSLGIDKARAIIRGLTAEQFTEAIDALNRAYRQQQRPYYIQAQEQGYVLTLRPRFRAVAEKLYGGVREARLSTAAVDVLALIAYRQPATKAEIDALRGAESGALIRQLVRRGLVQVVYRAEANQKEVSYGTTPRFLELFGLSHLDDLPRTQDLQQM